VKLDQTSSSSIEPASESLDVILSSLTVAGEQALLARGQAGAEDVLLVPMFPGVGSAKFQNGKENWCITPSLGICQAVFIASRSPASGGRLSLTHFAPTWVHEHIAALKELCELHRNEGYAEHHIVFAYPRKEYPGRYPSSITSQTELHVKLRSAIAELSPKSETIAYYSHIVCDSDSRSALVAHISEHGGGGRLVVDLFGHPPVVVW
jgi:hypothetical protein